MICLVLLRNTGQVSVIGRKLESEHKQVAIVSNRTDIVSMDGFRQ